MKKRTTFGCDPEIIFRDNNGLFIPANQFLSMYGRMGTDGASSVGELRPGYSESPTVVVGLIRDALKTINDKSVSRRYQIFAGHKQANMYIGGHIHIGNSEINDNTEIRRMFIKNLDIILEAFSNLTDDLKQKKARRLHSSYGKLGQYEIKPWGFEYRTPGSWVLNPLISYCYLTLTKLVLIGTLSYGLHIANYLIESGVSTDEQIINSLDKVFSFSDNGKDKSIGLVKDTCSKSWDWNQDIRKYWEV